jgi:transcriptional regulator with XRE-family HTH domain
MISEDTLSQTPDFHLRMRFLLQALNHSANSFARLVGVNPSQIVNAVGGRYSKPSADTLEKISSKVPRIDMNWLLSGQGEPLRSTVIQQSGNTGQTIGQVTGGTVNYTVDECREQLNKCRESEANLNKELAHARGRIIELMDRK